MKYESELSECPAGWHKLVTELLDALLDVPGFKLEHIQQIKEKFGGLRVYDSADLHSSSRARVDELVRKAEARAERTCQDCSVDAPGAVRMHTINHWMRSMCDDCAKKRAAP